MAWIAKQLVVDATPEEAWSALSDWGALHERLAPGFVTATELDGPDRIVTFFNGAVAREVLVSIDEAEMRLAWSITGGAYTHHNGVARILRSENGATVFDWQADVLPAETAPRTSEMMERGIQAVGAALAADRG